MVKVLHRGFSVSPKTPCDPDLTSPFEPKINRLRQTVEHYYCAKFQVILIRGFRFIVLTHTPTYRHTHCDKVIAISAPPYYVVGVDVFYSKFTNVFFKFLSRFYVFKRFLNFNMNVLHLCCVGLRVSEVLLVFSRM